MTPSTHALESLIGDVDVTYRAVRSLVFDRLPPGRSAEAQQLSTAQQLAVDRFARAERELADYRAFMYLSWSSSLSATG
jgi:hypothetical protein